METYQAILTRRSIRAFAPDPVPDPLIARLLEAAMYAPSARNTQPWHFIVINDRLLLDTMATRHPYAGMLSQAPLAIAVCGDRHIEPAEGYLAINCAAATQNLLLTAHDLELGSCWLGVYPREERIQLLRELLELPAHILPVSLVAVGYPNEIKATPRRFREDRIHVNHWPRPEPETGRL